METQHPNNVVDLMLFQLYCHLASNPMKTQHPKNVDLMLFQLYRHLASNPMETQHPNNVVDLMLFQLYCHLASNPNGDAASKQCC